MEIVFGPVPSRRLGLSLGIDLVPLKTCSLDCIYCELGRTATPVAERREYLSGEKIISEITAFFQPRQGSAPPRPDFITLSGSGEPTLNPALPRVIAELRRLSPAPLALLTNGTLFSDPRVRGEVADIDVILPSLDTVSEDIFRALNRPAPGLTAAGLVRGLVELRQEFKGEIWLEILFCHGLNDHPAEIERLVAACREIRPDRVQLNTVVRPGTLSSARPVSFAWLEKIRPGFGKRAEIIAPFTSKNTGSSPMGKRLETILATLKRRPCTVADLEKALGLKPAESVKMLDLLREKGEIESRTHEGREYFTALERKGESVT